MRTRILLMLTALLALGWAVQDAQAGAIRFAGKQIGKTSAYITSAAATGGENAAGGLKAFGKATGGAAKTSSVAVAKGAKKTPGLLARGTAATAKAIAKAVY